jgi:hypothetical protein
MSTPISTEHQLNDESLMVPTEQQWEQMTEIERA